MCSFEVCLLHNADAHLGVLVGEEGVRGGQGVRALLLGRAGAGQEAIHEEQAPALQCPGVPSVQPQRVQRHAQPPLRVWPALNL